MKASLVLDVILVTFALSTVLMASKKKTPDSAPANTPAKEASSTPTESEPTKVPATPSATAPVTPPAPQITPGAVK
jgi:type IV secretory pathway VirB10-like protein